MSKTHTVLRYIERSVYMKEINNPNLWNFELGFQKSMGVPVWTIIGFQQRDRQGSQNSNNDIFVGCPLIALDVLTGRKVF